jgi:hypothetical protein
MGRTSIDLRFLCGHTVSMGMGADLSSVACEQCGERRVSYVNAPSPSFRGTVSGPHATTTDLDPIKVRFGE